MQPITHLIYDFDGLLLDTEPIHARVNRTIAARYGKEFDASVRSKIMGRTAQDSAQLIIELLELPLTVEAYLVEKNAIIYDLYPTAHPMPGALQLTQVCYEAGIPQAIATSSAQKPFQQKTLYYQDWLRLFQCVVTGDDPEIQQGKPAPDCFLIAAARLGAKPENCLVLEDSIAGVTAAKQAGMTVVAVPARDMDKSLFQEADGILNSLLEFDLYQWFTLPDNA